MSSRASVARQVLTQPGLLAWGLFVLAVPFYVLPSGLPQPGDILIAFLVPAALYGWSGRLPRAFTRTVRAMIGFVIWVTVVNYTWALAVGNFTILKSYAIFPIYYVYNAAVFLIALVLYQRFGEIVLRVTVYVTVAAVAFQVGASFLFPAGKYRGELFFNSPNQLGFYALLSASLIAILQRRINYSVAKAAAGLTGCAYLALISGSRAAIAGIAILVFLLVFSNPRVIIAASIAATALLSLGGPLTRALDTVQQRVSQDRNPNTSFIEERGYDRLWRHAEYLPFGAGEGDVTRFQDRVDSPGEVHSSFATVLFSYGVVGLAVFLSFLWRLCRGASLRTLAMLLPTLAFTLAHNGLRGTLLWVLLAVFLIVKQPQRERSPAVERNLVPA